MTASETQFDQTGAKPAQTADNADLQLVLARLEQIQASLTGPSHVPSLHSGMVAPEDATSPRLASTMERIAYALQVIARVRRPDVPPNPRCDVISLTATNAGLSNSQVARGHVEVPTTVNENHSLASLAAQVDQLGQLLKKQERSARAVDKQCCTVDEVAELTGYKPWTIRQACNRGRISGRKGDDGRWRVPREEVARLQQSGLSAE